MMSRPAHTRKFLFLINPISGTRTKSGLDQQVMEHAEKHQYEAAIFPTVLSGDYQYVLQKIREENFTDVIICGGDGTVNQVINCLHATGVNFGIIPMGSGNGLANTAGIPKAPLKAIEIAFTGKPRFIDAFQVNDQFACMLCGLGFDAQVAHDFARQPSRGLLTYTQQTLKNYFTATPYHFELVVKDQVIKTEAFFISIANSNQFGNQFTIAPKASLNDGLLDIVIVPKMNKARLPFALIQQISTGRLANSREESGVGIQYFQTPKLQVRNKDLAPLHIDGEPREATEFLNVKILPRFFQLIQPVSH